MDLGEFLRLFPLRAPNVTWFLGAGASAGAGVPTANDLIWEFKRAIYCSERRVSVASCQDLGNERVRATIQQYFDEQGGAPTAGSAEEYAHYFEIAYPDPSDRRRRIDELVSAARPTFGHRALAALLAMGRIRVLWTTNFDRVVEDATYEVFGTSTKLVTATPDTSHLALQAINEGRWPLLVKLHGDFQSQRLKNTTEELRRQDALLRRALVEGCRRYGLVVVGYSGRDASVMAALEEAISGGHGFPMGVYWFTRPGAPVSEQVTAFLSQARGARIDANLVVAESFDELVGDVVAQLRDVPTSLRHLVERKLRRVIPSPVPAPGRGWPLIRTNALPLLSWPTTARCVMCEIGGTKEVREAVQAAGVNVLAVRSHAGVLAFGRDIDVRKAFSPFNINQFDLCAIDAFKLREDAVELGLLYDALAQAFASSRPLTARRRGGDHTLVVDLERKEDPCLARLDGTFPGISGAVPGTSVTWAAAVRIRLTIAAGGLHLLLDPTFAWNPAGDDAQDERAKDHIRELHARLYNRQANALLDAWVAALVGENSTTEVRTLGIADGVDATFTVARTTAFSWRTVK